MRKLLLTVIVLAIACLAFLAGGRYGGDQVNGSRSRAERQVLYYTDPMTPGFRSDKPGIAPCGMPLEPVYAEAGDQGSIGTGLPPQSPGAVKIHPGKRQLLGVQVSSVEMKPMTYTLRLYGRIVPDETKIYRVNTSTDSWVRTLAEITTGSIVSKDQILAEVLDPDFYTAQVTYLVSLGNVERYQKQRGEPRQLRQYDLADNQMRVAVQDVLNLGITEAQVEELARTRKAQPLLQVRSPVNGVVLSRNLTLYQWLKAGEEFYRIADLGRVWVYADVYEDEAMHLRPGMEVNITHGQMGRSFTAKVSEVLPLFDPVARTLKVRFDVDNPRYDLRPDMFVDVQIPITLPDSLHVPADAVIDSGTRKIVYVDIGNSTFEPRRVETGLRLGRRVEITSGLMPGEKVIVSGNFLVDSESRMKTAAAGMHGTTSRDPVCGMEVDEEQAETSGNTAIHRGRTFYFCMVQCRDSFEQDPERYVQKLATSGKTGEHGVKAVKSQDWLEMLQSAENEHGMEESGPLSGERTGWDAFTGSKYFGLPETPKKPPAQQDDMPGVGRNAPPGKKQERPAAAPAPPSAAHQPGMKHEMREMPAAEEQEQPPSR